MHHRCCRATSASRLAAPLVRQHAELEVVCVLSACCALSCQNSDGACASLNAAAFCFVLQLGLRSLPAAAMF